MKGLGTTTDANLEAQFNIGNFLASFWISSEPRT